METTLQLLKDAMMATPESARGFLIGIKYRSNKIQMDSRVVSSRHMHLRQK
jgi:hypothetical protein